MESSDPYKGMRDGETDERPFREYANNAYFDSNVWDLTIVFGQLELREFGPNLPTSVDWHTAVTVPWLQAKILCYYLNLNLLVHEAFNGEIAIPGSLVPPEPSTPPNAPQNEQLVAAIQRLREDFFKGAKT